MSYRIRCATKFDITATGVKSQSRSSRMPFVDEHGQVVDDMLAWTRSRNQQRNWETLNQLISLRALPENISNPAKENDWWVFEFTIDNIETVSTIETPLALLLKDCQDVPMIIGLDELATKVVTLDATSENPNIIFSLITHK